MKYRVILTTLIATMALGTAVVTQSRPDRSALPETAPGGRPPDSVFLEDLTWAEVRDLIAAGTTSIIVGTAGTEQKGPHMVDGEHRFVTTWAADKIARRLGRTLVAPVITYVPEGSWTNPGGHMGKPGTITLPQDRFVELLVNTGRSLKAGGFRTIIFIGDSGGNQSGMQTAAARLNEVFGESARALWIGDYYTKSHADQERYITEKLGIPANQIGGHANILDTSEMLFVNPAHVRKDKLAPGGGYQNSGVSGDPTKATAALGRVFLQIKVDNAVAQIQGLMSGTIPPAAPAAGREGRGGGRGGGDAAGRGGAGGGRGDAAGRGGAAGAGRGGDAAGRGGAAGAGRGDAAGRGGAAGAGRGGDAAGRGGAAGARRGGDQGRGGAAAQPGASTARRPPTMETAPAGVSPTRPPDTVFIDELTWEETRDLMKAGATTVIIPTGGTEKNGYHMVLGKHNFIVTYAANVMARRLGKTLVAPTIQYVPEGNPDRAGPGVISHPSPAYNQLLDAAARSLQVHGFTRIIFIGDSGGNQAGMTAVADALNAEWQGSGTRVFALTDYYNRGREHYRAWLLAAYGYDDDTIGSHAGISDTSQLLFVHPSGVRKNQIKPWGGARDSGVSGDPTKASAAIGKMGIEFKVNAAIEQLRAVR